MSSSDFHQIIPANRLDWRRDLLALGVGLMVILLWFSPWWAGGKCLAPLDLLNEMMSPWKGDGMPGAVKNHHVSDGVDQYLVYRMMAAESFAKEGQIGWTSLKYGGTAEYANTMALYFDWTMQLHRWFGFWTAWHLGLLGQVLLAAFGMYFFLRGRGLIPLWAICGGLVYAANSHFVAWIFHRWALGAFCWVPWIFFFVDLNRRGRRWAWGFVPAAIGMAFFGGTLQHAALVVLAVVALWADQLMGQRGNLREMARVSIRFAFWGLLGAGLAGVMFFPCIAAFLESNRLGLHMGMHGRNASGLYPAGNLQPLLNLLAYPLMVFPSILGRSDTIDVLKAFRSEMFYVIYCGFFGVLLGYLAMFRRRAPTFARILIGAGLILPLTPLVRVLYQRLYLLFILGAIFAAVHYLQLAGRAERLRLFRWLVGLTTVALCGWGAASVVLELRPSIEEWVVAKITSQAGGSFGYYREWMTTRAVKFAGDLVPWSPQQAWPMILLGIGLAGFRMMACLDRKWIAAGALIVASAMVLEVTVWASRWVVWSDPGLHPLFAETEESQVLRKEVGGEGRVTCLIHPEAHMALTPFIPNTLSPYGIASITGYDSIVPDGMILPNEASDDATRQGRMGVTHLITWAGNPLVPQPWERVWSGPRMDLYRNPLAVGRYITFSNQADRETFFAGGTVPTGRAVELSGRENSRTVEIPVAAESLRIAENWAEGWEFRRGGEEDWRPVERAPDKSMLMSGLRSGGPARLEMRYRPWMREAGQTCSLVSVGVLFGFGLLTIRQKLEAEKGNRREPGECGAGRIS